MICSGMSAGTLGDIGCCGSQLPHPQLDGGSLTVNGNADQAGEGLTNHYIPPLPLDDNKNNVLPPTEMKQRKQSFEPYQGLASWAFEFPAAAGTEEGPPIATFLTAIIFD